MITGTGTYGVKALTQISDTFVNPTLPTLSSPEAANFETDLASSGVANGDAGVGAAQLLAALKTYFEGTYALATLKLDATLTVTANLTITNFVRVNDAANTMQIGTDVYRVQVSVQYV